MKKTIHQNIIIIILFLVACIATSIHLFLDANYSIVMLHAAGACIATLFVTINEMDNKVNADYIQTGEAAACSFALYISIRFFTQHTIGLIIITTLTSIIINRIHKLFFDTKRDDSPIYGAIVNIIILITLVFLARTDTIFNVELLVQTAWGMFPFQHITIMHSLILSILSCIVICVYSLLQSNQLPFLYGDYTGIQQGIKKIWITIPTVILRSIVLSATILLIGWQGFVGVYTNILFKRKTPAIATLLSIFIFLTALFIIEHYLSKKYYIVFFYIFSYILMFYFRKKRVSYYDRV